MASPRGPFGGHAKHDCACHGRHQRICLVGRGHGTQSRAKRASRPGHRAEKRVAVVDAEGPPPVADEISRSREEHDASSLAGERLDEGGALGYAKWWGGGIDASLDDGRPAVHGLYLGLVALDDGEGA